MLHLAHQRNVLQPSEALFDPLPFLLTDLVSAVPRRPLVDCAASPGRRLLDSSISRRPPMPGSTKSHRIPESRATARRFMTLCGTSPTNWSASELTAGSRSTKSASDQGVSIRPTQNRVRVPVAHVNK